ncbi:DedA family protein [Kyrpidia spormannii]|uniref:DedA family protein n=1 Tax=Kyrpidia spormannii TaxID=2055160 RepID=UPI0012FFD5EA|nr:DedA family protein [Kyrpidia spormannii]
MHSTDLLQFIAAHGYAALALILATGLIGLPVPDEVLLTFAGFLTWQGIVHLPGTAASAFLGSCSGITLSYVMGRGIFRRIADRVLRRAMESGKLAQATRWMDQYGGWALFFAYFFPGIRHVAAYVAGVGRMAFRRFAKWAYAGAALWVLTFLFLGRWLGPRWHVVERWMHHWTLWAAVVLVAVTAIGLWWLRRVRPVRNRS